MLLVAIMVLGGFPFVPKQNAILTLLTEGIPTLALAAWARPGLSPRRSSHKTSFRFAHSSMAYKQPFKLVPGLLTCSRTSRCWNRRHKKKLDNTCQTLYT